MKVNQRRKLDNSAQLFPLISTKNFSTVFRLSCVLKEKIQPNVLQQAVQKALDCFPCFRVKMKRDFFNYYLESNEEEPVIKKEGKYPCRYINPKDNHDYLFQVMYGENTIHLDIFHALTDGNYGMKFLKEIVYQYLEIAHEELMQKNIRAERLLDYTVEDSYLVNYDKHLKGVPNTKRAFLLKGKNVKLGKVGVQHVKINLTQLKNKVKQAKVTMTQYLTAMLIDAIYEVNYKRQKGKRPIKICIPVDLRKYFNSKTVSNFFSYITVETHMKEQETFESILQYVKKDFQAKLTEEEMKKTMSMNVKLGTNPWIRTMPLDIKKMALKIGYGTVQKYTTATLSNIGKIGVIADYKPYIETFLFCLAPELVERVKCAVCSFEDTVVFTFTSILQDTSMQQFFVDLLKKNQIAVCMETNEFSVL